VLITIGSSALAATQVGGDSSWLRCGGDLFLFPSFFLEVFFFCVNLRLRLTDFLIFIYSNELVFVHHPERDSLSSVTDRTPRRYGDRSLVCAWCCPAIAAAMV